MKKIALISLGALCMLLGLVFVIIPGPSLIFFIAGLFCLSFYYPKARDYLTLCQKALTKSCAYIDKKLARWFLIELQKCQLSAGIFYIRIFILIK